MNFFWFFSIFVGVSSPNFKNFAISSTKLVLAFVGSLRPLKPSHDPSLAKNPTFALPRFLISLASSPKPKNFFILEKKLAFGLPISSRSFEKRENMFPHFSLNANIPAPKAAANPAPSPPKPNPSSPLLSTVRGLSLSFLSFRRAASIAASNRLRSASFMKSI